MKKILITGANGFIGKNLVSKLQEKYSITFPGREVLNLLDEEAVASYLKQNDFDLIIHAANTNDTRNINITNYDVLDANLRMFFNLERCKDYYKKMYYFGSGAEYDMNHSIPDMKEDYFDTYVPKDSYGFSKYIMSKTCEQNNNIYDLRLFGVYGKYEEWERRFISNAICRALMGKNITIQKNVYFDYLWVDDLCNIMFWFIENTPTKKHYNVCRGSKMDLYSLACLVREILNIDCDIIISEPGWKPEYTGDNKRLLAEIGNYPFTGFKESITALCEYYKEHIDLIDVNKLQ
ncbi:MAG: NAD-dependent epimerase/dehydratase [Clostridium sp.]|nr:NAD-dependent epimerase/dehydratase [Clostridium sp.]